MAGKCYEFTSTRLDAANVARFEAEAVKNESKTRKMLDALEATGKSHVGYGPLSDDDDPPFSSRTPAYRFIIGARGVIGERIRFFRTGKWADCNVHQHSARFEGDDVMHVFVFHPEIAWFSNVMTSFHYAITYTARGIELKHAGLLPATAYPLSILLHSHALHTHGATAFCCFPLESMASIFKHAKLAEHATLFEQDSTQATTPGFFHADDLRGVPTNTGKQRRRCWPLYRVVGTAGTQPLTVIEAKSSFLKLWGLHGCHAGTHATPRRRRTSNNNTSPATSDGRKKQTQEDGSFIRVSSLRHRASHEILPRA